MVNCQLPPNSTVYVTLYTCSAFYMHKLTGGVNEQNFQFILYEVTTLYTCTLYKVSLNIAYNSTISVFYMTYCLPFLIGLLYKLYPLSSQFTHSRIAVRNEG